jgi:hypothetical protein
MRSLLRRINWARWGRLLRRYWWVYPAWLVLKWGTIFLLGNWAWEAWFAV